MIELTIHNILLQQSNQRVAVAFRVQMNGINYAFDLIKTVQGGWWLGNEGIPEEIQHSLLPKHLANVATLVLNGEEIKLPATIQVQW